MALRRVAQSEGLVWGRFWKVAVILAVAGLASTLGCRGPSKADAEKSAKASATGESSDATAQAARKAPAPEASAKAEPEAAKAAPVPAEEDLREEDDVTTSDHVAPSEEPLLALFRELRDGGEAHVAWVRSQLEREPAIKAESDKLTAEEVRLGIPRAIPETHDAAQIEAEWQGLAQIQGFTITSWMMSKSDLDERPLPDTIPADKEFAPASSDVRNVYQIVVKVPQMAEADLKRLLEGVAGFQRLTLVRQIKPVFTGFHLINAEVYEFKPTDKPKFVLPERSVEAAMAQLRINLTVRDAVRKDPIGYVQTASLAYAEYTASRPKAEQVAALEGKLLWQRARRAFFDAKLAEVKAVTYAAVSRPSTGGAK